MKIIELIKAILFGIVEGITEWLPISSTGHLILLDEFLTLDVSAEFMELFEVVIQLGAILAVIVIYFDRLYPFSKNKNAAERSQTWRLLFTIVFAVIPSAVIGLLFDDWFSEKFYNSTTVAVTLILYGVAFIVIEKLHKNKTYTVNGKEISGKELCEEGYNVSVGWIRTSTETEFEVK